jgi:hypothetical protein
VFSLTSTFGSGVGLGRGVEVGLCVGLAVAVGLRVAVEVGTGVGVMGVTGVQLTISVMQIINVETKKNIFICGMSTSHKCLPSIGLDLITLEKRITGERKNGIT